MLHTGINSTHDTVMIYLERGWDLAKYFIVFQFNVTACECELVSETRKASIDLSYCHSYSLITSNGSLPKIFSNANTKLSIDSKPL